MGARNFQVNHPSELNSLTSTPLLRTARPGVIRLSPEFEHPQKEQWEADINRHYRACGCSTGAKGLLLMLIVGTALGVVAYGAGILTFMAAGAVPVVGAILGSVIG